VDTQSFVESIGVAIWLAGGLCRSRDHYNTLLPTNSLLAPFTLTIQLLQTTFHDSDANP